MLLAVSQQKGRNWPGSGPELDPAKHGPDWRFNAKHRPG